ncbi:MAG: IPT/TIG domain-containing protein, partial [Solirubrobacterales bacterium]|nr:IPT/TIG domain-containing protein [Solirubrobacterales bacterium]
PRGIAITPNGKTLYVPVEEAKYVIPIDLEDNTSETQIPVAGSPDGIAIVPDRGPSATFTETVAEAGKATTFDAAGSIAPEGGTIASYHWSFGDGASETTTTPEASHVYAAGGEYRVTLTETDGEGCSEALVFTGQTAYCKEEPFAKYRETITVAGPTQPKPVITSITPDEGPETGGTKVVIHGEHLENTSEVQFESTEEVHPSKVTSTEVEVEAPPNKEGAVEVCVRTPGGQGCKKEAFTYTGLPKPVVSSVTPDEGPEAGGTVVTIHGEHLEDATGVFFAGGAAVIPSKDTATEIEVATPKGSGIVSVCVETAAAEGEQGCNASGFTYKQPPLTLARAGTGSGAVECEANSSGSFGPCKAEYPDGTKLVLEGKAAAGSKFAGWSGGGGSAASCEGTANCSFTITAASSVTATFEPGKGIVIGTASTAECLAGGITVEVEGEPSTKKAICNGASGSSGKSIVTGAASTAECPAGGITVEVKEEPSTKTKICNGVAGASGKPIVTGPASTAECPAGGITVEVEGVPSTKKAICDGASVTVATVAIGNATCPEGGLAVTSSGGTADICNGVGMSVATVAAGSANCPEGGVALTSASGTVYVCNGTAGSKGAPGKDGANGKEGPAGKPGASGPEGPQGKEGKRGPAGVVGKIVCKAEQTHGEIVVHCKVDGGHAQNGSRKHAHVSRVHWRLMRDGRAVRHGSSAVGGRWLGLRLRSLSRGRYLLQVQGEGRATVIVVHADGGRRLRRVGARSPASSHTASAMGHACCAGWGWVVNPSRSRP